MPNMASNVFSGAIPRPYPGSGAILRPYPDRGAGLQARMASSVETCRQRLGSAAGVDRAPSLNCCQSPARTPADPGQRHDESRRGAVMMFNGHSPPTPAPPPRRIRPAARWSAADLRGGTCLQGRRPHARALHAGLVQDDASVDEAPGGTPNPRRCGHGNTRIRATIRRLLASRQPSEAGKIPIPSDHVALRRPA
jgi:hypothetical protein